MYAGFITTKHASNWIGAHQKLDRLAFRALKSTISHGQGGVRAKSALARFPDIKTILHFEGVNGPDGIKVKSPSQEEPWHFYDPYDEHDRQIFQLFDGHSRELAKAMRSHNNERAAFEAAWLAHAVVDGLTPAHHYPYAEEIEEIHGAHHTERTTRAQKVFPKGETKRETFKRNWKILGRKGLLSTHQNFEIGIASMLMSVHRAPVISPIEVAYAREHGLHDVFRTTACFVADLHLYSRFYKYGWTVRLTRDVRRILIPQLVKTIALAWLLTIENTST